MLKSMTGYGVATAENDQLSVSVELKSLNSKFLDLTRRLAKEYADKEIEIRNLFPCRIIALVGNISTCIFITSPGITGNAVSSVMG